jgi:nitrate reductase NapE component
VLDEGPQNEGEESERELLDVIGPEIERRQRRREFRNFIVLVVAVFGFVAVAYWAWKLFLGSPTTP